MTILLQRTKILFSTTLIAAALFAGCGDSEDFVFTNTNAVPVQPIAQPPLAQADSFQALGDATLNQAAAGVLANDTVNGATITAFDAIGSQGGAINLNGDGSFAYTPVVGFVGAETFTYTLSNADGDSTATVTLTSTGFGRFVDNSGANGTGTQASPFNNLPDAVTAAQNGDTIYVARGNGTNSGMTGGVNLPPGVDLIGEGIGLILSQTIEPQGQAPMIEGPIICGGDNTVSGFHIDASGSVGVGASGVANITVTDNTFANDTANHVEVTNVTGQVVVNNNTFGPTTLGCVDMDFDNISDVSVTFDDNVLNDDGTVNPSGHGLNILFQGTTTGSVVAMGNTLDSPDNAASFEAGLRFRAQDTAQAVVNFTGNMITNTEDTGIFVEGSGSGQSITSTIQENTVTGAGGRGIGLSNNAMATVTGNSAADTGSRGISFTVTTSDVTGQAIISGNNISDTGSAAIAVSDNIGSGTEIRAAVRSNTITTTATNAIDLVSRNVGCFAVTGNTVNKDIEIEANNTPCDLEQGDVLTGGPLDTLNTLNAGAVVEFQTFSSGSFTFREAGFCGF
jgi:hypothetical protein